MHPLTCYAGQICLCHAKIEKISEHFFVMTKENGGGTIFVFYRGDSCYEGDIELMGVPPLEKTLPGMAVFGRSAVVSPAFKKHFYKELQTPFLIENNNKNNRKIERTIKN